MIISLDTSALSFQRKPFEIGRRIPVDSFYGRDVVVYLYFIHILQSEIHFAATN